MALEYRNGRAYYYRKIRQGNKVISEYAGSEELALIHQDEQYAKKNHQQAQKVQQAQHIIADEELIKLERNLNEIFTIVAIANGYYKHKRQWRKKHQNKSKKK